MMSKAVGGAKGITRIGMSAATIRIMDTMMKANAKGIITGSRGIPLCPMRRRMCSLTFTTRVKTTVVIQVPMIQLKI